MARLITAGAEWADATGAADGLSSGDPFYGGGLPTIESTIVRSGSKSYKFTTAGSDSGKVLAASIGGNTFARTYVRFAAWPSEAVVMAGIATGYTDSYGTYASWAASLNVSTSGVLSNNLDASTQQLVLDTWYRIEMYFAGGGVAGSQFRVDGVNFGTTHNISAYGNEFFVLGVKHPDYVSALANGINIYHDDIAMNFASGTYQNSWCGEGRIRLARPISDNARGTGWVTGIAGTTNLYDAVDNVPPIGVALISATGTSQIKDLALTTTENYDANVTNYTTLGVGIETIALVRAIANLSSSNANGRDMAVRLVSNPADSGEVVATVAGAAASYPTGWNWYPGNIVYEPTVTLGTSPVVRIGKRQSTTDAAMCDAMGLVVESYVPVTATPIPSHNFQNRQAVKRASFI